MIYQAGFASLLAASGAALGVPGLDAFKEYNFQKCPHGFTRKHNQCVREMETAPQPLCPTGSLIEEGVCGVIEAPQYICDGHIVDVSCEKKRTTNISVKCPEDTTASHGKCIVPNSLIVCPPGSGLFIEGTRDVCGNITPAQPECPPEFRYDGAGGCVLDREATPEPVCPAGTVLNENTGECEVTITYEKVCPKGSQLQGDKCVVVTPPEAVCPTGTVLVGLDCVSERTIAPTPICPLGGELQGDQCTITTPYPLTPTCLTGQLVHGECISELTEKPQYKCPDHYTLVQGKKGVECVGTITYDCSTTHYECDKSRDHDITVRKETKLPFEVPSHLRHVVDDSKTDALMNNDILAHTVHEVHDYCYKVPVVTPKTCEEKRTAQPIPFCENGIFNGHKCVITETTQPTLICEATETATGECVIVATYPAALTCDEPWVLTGGKKHVTCSQTFVVPSGIQCRQGTLVGEQCETIVPAICPVDNCEALATYKPVFQCPIDYILIGGHPAGCTQRVFTPARFICPSGTTPRPDGLSCFREVAAVIEDLKAVVPAELSCPNGFGSTGHECLGISYHIVDLDCKSGVLRGGICIVATAPKPYCAPGYISKDGMCVVPISTSPLRIGAPVMKIDKDWTQEVQKNLPNPTKFIGIPKIPFF